MECDPVEPPLPQSLSHSVLGTQASRSPEHLFTPWAGGEVQRHSLRVPDEAIGGVDNLLIGAQSIQLTHYGGHPAHCVEHRLAHLRGKQVQVGVLATVSEAAAFLTSIPAPTASLGFKEVFCGRLHFCSGLDPCPPYRGPTFQLGTSFMMMASSSRFSRSICRIL